MRIRCAFTIEIDDDGRRALAAYLGRPGELATREECRDFQQTCGDAGWNDIRAEWEAEQ